MENYEKLLEDAEKELYSILYEILSDEIDKQKLSKIVSKKFKTTMYMEEKIVTGRGYFMGI